jgi:hypothetical protein
MDLVAGNIGLNSAYQQVAPGRWYLCYGDLNGDGQTQILEAYYDGEMRQIVLWRQMGVLEKTLPWLRQRFPTHAAFSEASLDQVVAGRPGPVHRLIVKHLASTVFLNRGDHFEARLLPREAQWAPVFGISVADFDGDGHEDLFLSQNNYAVRPDDARLDSGRGLLLRGDGTGGFSPLAGAESGIVIYGEQRGCAVADFDHDGRVDLAVAEQNGPLHLYRNQTGHPGLEVTLKGGPANPNGIGSSLRLRFADHVGPAREIHGGGGYWSQDSTRVVLATPTAPTHLEVRWPGGKQVVTALPPGANRIEVTEAGLVTASDLAAGGHTEQ